MALLSVRHLSLDLGTDCHLVCCGFSNVFPPKGFLVLDCDSLYVYSWFGAVSSLFEAGFSLYGGVTRVYVFGLGLHGSFFCCSRGPPEAGGEGLQ